MERLKILDGLRVIAIIMVMFFHYSYLYNGQFYTVSFPDKNYFKYGYLGVELFFMISGFVITLTLTKSTGLFNFLKKRWVRLFPGMLICSVLTFLIITIFDSENYFPDSKNIVNLFISNTFISPAVINPIFKVKTAYIDAPYWSLWVEIQFYIIIGLIYFLNKTNFIRNFILVSVSLATLFFVSHQFEVLPSKVNWFFRVVLEIFNFSQHALWFVLGVLIFKLYYVSKNILTFLLIFVIALLQLWFLNFEYYSIFFMVICTFIFYSFLYNQKLLGFLTNSLFQKIAIASYAIYLIHQNLGLLLLSKLDGVSGSANLLLPVLIMIVFFYTGIILYIHFEKPLGNYLKKKLKI